MSDVSISLKCWLLMNKVFAIVHMSSGQNQFQTQVHLELLRAVDFILSLSTQFKWTEEAKVLWGQHPAFSLWIIHMLISYQARDAFADLCPLNSWNKASVSLVKQVTTYTSSPHFCFWACSPWNKKCSATSLSVSHIPPRGLPLSQPQRHASPAGDG